MDAKTTLAIINHLSAVAFAIGKSWPVKPGDGSLCEPDELLKHLRDAKEHLNTALSLLGEEEPPLLVVIEGGMLEGVYTKDESLIGRNYTKVDYDTDDVDEDELTTVRQSNGGGDVLAIVETFEIERATVRVITTEDYERAARKAGYAPNAAGRWEHPSIGEDGMSDVRALCEQEGIEV